MVEMVRFGRAVEDCAEECDLRVKACLCSQSPVDWCSHPLAPLDLILSDAEEPPPECPLRQAPFVLRLHEKFLDRPQRDPLREVAEYQRKVLDGLRLEVMRYLEMDTLAYQEAPDTDPELFERHKGRAAAFETVICLLNKLEWRRPDDTEKEDAT